MIPALVGDKETLNRFLAEARATMRLTHRHIVRTHNVFQEGDNYFIVMEHMAGGSLEKRLDEGGTLSEDESVRVADWYDAEYYVDAPRDNPPGPDSGTYRVLRRGGWKYGGWDLRMAFRSYDPLKIRRDLIGFRRAVPAGK